MLAKCVSDNHRDWDEWLPQVAFCYNASVHESTKFTPFFLMHGSEPRWDVDIQLGDEGAVPKSVNEYAQTLLSIWRKPTSLPEVIYTPALPG